MLIVNKAREAAACAEANCASSFTNATNATTSATNAANSATAAAASAAAAATSETNTENLWEQFNALYLGSFAVAPTTDNEGNPLQEGALYWNSVSNTMFAWDGSAWATATNFNEFTNFTATGTTTARNLVTRFSDVVNVLDFGADPTGATNSYSAFQAAAAAVTDNTKIVIPDGNYTIAYSGGYVPLKPLGVIAFELVNKTNVHVVGEGAIITITNHDITANGGLSVFAFMSCKDFSISGIKFNLSYTGFNNSASYYPQNRAIAVENSGSGGSQPQSALWRNGYIYNCAFNISHPQGMFRATTNPYSGDSNNGFKNMAIKVFGDEQAVNSINQNSSIRVENNYFATTHNGYCIWVWATNNAVVSNNIYDGVATYSTQSDGTTKDSSVPLLRVHQMYCKEGVIIQGNTFVGRKRADRVGTLDGNAAFVGLVSNTYGLNTGSAQVLGNKFVLSSSITTNYLQDIGIAVQGYCGNILIDGNSFSSNDTTFNTVFPPRGIIVGSSTNQTTGANYITISNNIFDRSCDIVECIYVQQGASTAAGRLTKSLVVENNTCNGFYKEFAIITSAGLTVDSVEYARIANNTINGMNNTTIPIANSDCRPIYIGGGAASDVYEVKNNTINGANFAIYISYSPVGLFYIEYNKIDNASVKVTAAFNRVNGYDYSGQLQPAVGSAATLPVGSSIQYWYHVTGYNSSGNYYNGDSGVAVGGATVGIAFPGISYKLQFYRIGEQ